jgi:hypothetical protein
MKIIIVADKEDENYKKFLGVPIIWYVSKTRQL